MNFLSLAISESFECLLHNTYLFRTDGCLFILHTYPNLSACFFNICKQVCVPADLGSAPPAKNQSKHQEDAGLSSPPHAAAHHHESQEVATAQFWDACLVPSPTAEQRRFFRHRALQYSASNQPCFVTVDACVEHSTAAMAQPVLIACNVHLPLFGVSPSALANMSSNTIMPINPMVPVAADPQSRALQAAQSLVAVVPGAAGTAGGEGGASPTPTSRDPRFTYGLLGPVLGALEPEPSPMAGIHAAMDQFKSSSDENSGGNADASAGSNLAAAADHATATFRVRVLLETDAPAWLSCTAVDTLRGDAPSGAKTGALLKTPPVLVKGRGHPHVFVVKGLKPLRRYLLRFDGLADASSRTAILHTPPAPTNQRTLQCVTVSGHDAQSHGEDPPPSAPLRAGGENGGKAQGAVGGTSEGGAIAWGIWGGLAERLAVPWHGVDLVMHLGGCIDSREALQEAVAWLMAADDSDDGTYNPADASSASSSADASSASGDDAGGSSPAAAAAGSLSAVAAQRRQAAIDEAIAERFRDLIRKAWSSPSVRAVLSSCPQLMLPGTSDYGLEAASRQGLLAELLNLQGGVPNSTEKSNNDEDNASSKAKDKSKSKDKSKTKDKKKVTEAGAAADASPPATGAAAALQSAQSSAVIAAKALRAAHRCFASLRRVLHMYCRSLSPPVSIAACTPREVPVSLGASGDSASLGPLYGSPYVQLFLGGKVAVVALDLWGSNTGKPLDEATPDEGNNTGSIVTTESSEVPSSSKAKKKTLKKGNASAQSLQPVAATGKKEDSAQSASSEPRGLLGAAQWAGLLNLLSGHHPHQMPGASGDDDNDGEDEDVQAVENGDDDEDENIGGLHDEDDDEDDDDENGEGQVAGGPGDDDDDDDGVANANDGTNSSSTRFEPSLLVVAAELPFLWMSAPPSEKDRIAGVTEASTAGIPQSGASAAGPIAKEAPQITATARAGAAGAGADAGEPPGNGNVAPGPTNTTLAGRRVAPSVLARNWTHGHHYNELATLFEALLTWRNKPGREVLLLCGSGGGCEAGLETTLRVLPGQGPLGALAADKNQERTLGMLCSGPIGREVPKVAPQGFVLEGRAGGVSGRDPAYCLGYTHNRVVKEKNYAVVTLGVTPAAAAAALTSAANTSSVKPTNAWVGWWSGEIVSGREMEERHPLPHRVQADDDEAQVAASLRLDMESLGAGRLALSQLRAPPWWDQKFVKKSDGEILYLRFPQN